MINRSQDSFVHSSSVGWPSNSSLSADDVRMDKRSTLAVHQLFFDQLNHVANLGRGPLKGHWFKGIDSGDESAIRESMDAALSQNKWAAVQTLHLYARALREHQTTGSCCLSHTDRIQRLIALRLTSEDVWRELSTIDLSRGVNVIGDQNNVNVGGDHNTVNVIGHSNQVTVNGHHNQVARTNPIDAWTSAHNANVSTTANPNHSDVLGLRENAFP
ncbi:MAG: hypothetical protein ACT6UH_11330 [Hydrogenophaga sp.]|uniref:hypothetical protein n=1 Tax=Hydrogenophaga sp. TaxID=1904254 RepID=UPI0040367EBB